MKLPDFTKNDTFEKLRRKMGIPKGYYARYSGKVNFKKLSLKEIQFDNIEYGRGLDINLDELDISDDKTIIYDNRNVVLYIRDQYSYDTEYKFHVAWCKTLKEMRRNNKLNRYVISRRTDGTFYVNMFDKSSHRIAEENAIRKLGVCKNCLSELNYNNYSSYTYVDKNNIYENFKIEEFLEKYDTRIKSLPTYTENTAPLNQYPSNWKEVSDNYREARGWKCEKCKKDCSNNKGYLDVHHIDSNKFNTKSSNLKALCKKCHSEEFGHGHYKAIANKHIIKNS